MYINWFTRIICIDGHICYTKKRGNENSPDSLNVMVNYHYHGESKLITQLLSSMPVARYIITTISSQIWWIWQVFCPPHYQKSTNFENVHHGNNNRFDESGKPEDSSNAQDAISKDHWDLLKASGRGHRMVPWIATTATFRPLLTAGIMALWSTSCQGKHHGVGIGGERGKERRG